jgi:Spy/CpxP family protein refolding chaperone
MKKSITLFAVALFTAAVGFAQQGGGERRGPMNFAAMYGEKLALTDAQKDQIKAIETKTREDNKEFFESSRKLNEEMRAAREANDSAKMDSLKPAMKESREKMTKIRAAELEKIKPVLTADQRTQLDKLIAEREAQRKERQQ